MKKVELLSPAGDMERLRVTLLYGADAVYIGGTKYSLRANATNFSIEQIKEACSFAHSLNKKVYLTLNIVFHNSDIDGVDEYIREVVDAGIDAFIVSDPFIISHIREKYDVEVHLSTQACTTNKDSVLLFKEEGVNRVVLAREVSIKEIKEIIDETKVDIEVFIHGAMCTFYSGRCVLSNHLTNRDSNRGGCSQVCRFAFNIDNNKEKFTMATKDLNMSNHIKDLLDIGVTSLKVEGRMRSLYYLATVIGAYRKIIDAYYEGNLSDEYLYAQVKILNRVANRETSTHFFLREADYTDQYYTGRQELSNQDYLGLITEYNKNEKVLTLIERNYFEKGWEVELFTPNKDSVSFKIDEVYDEELNPIGIARHPEQIIKLKLNTNIDIPKYSMLRVKVEE